MNPLQERELGAGEAWQLTDPLQVGPPRIIMPTPVSRRSLLHPVYAARQRRLKRAFPEFSVAWRDPNNPFLFGVTQCGEKYSTRLVSTWTVGKRLDEHPPEELGLHCHGSAESG
jgi:hypothetical protein